MATKVLATATAAALALLATFPVLLASGDLEPTSRCTSVSGGTATDAIAAALRHHESGNDYRAQSDRSTASGAYQFTDTTWAGYAGYPRAVDAPAAVQDAKAAEHITAILNDHHGNPAAVPVVWYLGYIPAPQDPAWNTVPNPAAGNRLTPRQYQTQWLETYATLAPEPPHPPTDCDPSHPDRRQSGSQPGHPDLTTVEHITVHTQIAQQVAGLVHAARADGHTLTGGGYRSPQHQIELRRQNCGSSNYAIYEMPSNQCSPPTARPGSSNHELGLAVDFSCNGALIRSRSSACFAWLSANAPSFGLQNLPSEPWHWSVDGT